MLGGLAQINIEITSRCNKQTLCGFCGHQNAAIHPRREDGDMGTPLVKALAREVPTGIVVQFHRDGDPLAYGDDLRIPLHLFDGRVRSIVTHGETLGTRAPELIGHCESVCVSIFRGDPDREIQLASLRSFLDQKGDQLPRVFLKVVGDMSDVELVPYVDLGVPLMRRLLHIARNNSRYTGGMPAMPEHGMCLDLLHHPSVAWNGDVYLCNRLDSHGAGILGNCYAESLSDIWNGERRAQWVQSHRDGRREDVPLCRDCHYYGIPTA